MKVEKSIITISPITARPGDTINITFTHGKLDIKCPPIRKRKTITFSEVLVLKLLDRKNKPPIVVAVPIVNTQ